MFKDGDHVEFVQDAIVLESLISKFLFNQAASRRRSRPAASVVGACRPTVRPAMRAVILSSILARLRC
jgi:hypothetical protein